MRLSDHPDEILFRIGCYLTDTPNALVNFTRASKRINQIIGRDRPLQSLIKHYKESLSMRNRIIQLQGPVGNDWAIWSARYAEIESRNINITLSGKVLDKFGKEFSEKRQLANMRDELVSGEGGELLLYYSTKFGGKLHDLHLRIQVLVRFIQKELS
jgi:hypothetical protein